MNFEQYLDDLLGSRNQNEKSKSRRELERELLMNAIANPRMDFGDKLSNSLDIAADAGIDALSIPYFPRDPHGNLGKLGKSGRKFIKNETQRKHDKNLLKNAIQGNLFDKIGYGVDTIQELTGFGDGHPMPTPEEQAILEAEAEKMLKRKLRGGQTGLLGL